MKSLSACSILLVASFYSLSLPGCGGTGSTTDAPTPCTIGEVCDDANACTENDRCDDQGQCIGESVSCDDGRICTVDLCDVSGKCSHELGAGYCLINGVCFEDGQAKPDNDCVECMTAVSKSEWTNDDTNQCGAEDKCHAGAYCSAGQCLPGAVAMECNDDNICTVDSCDSAKGCVHENSVLPCDDGDMCTTQDVCVAGACSGIAVDCDDGNECTADDCDPIAGCTHEPIAGGCDDGDGCTSDDECSDEGVCIGVGCEEFGLECVDGECENPTLVCLLNNCQEDAHCTGCSDGRQTCLVEANRCVACDPVAGTDCSQGQVCSSFGICVEDQLTCPTDEEGEPTNPCVENADCSPCSPNHQVCNPETNKCQACTSMNTSYCLASQFCLSGSCSPKCPQSCIVDADCQNCGGPESPAYACNNHKCSQCSPTWPCEAGKVCLPQGVCSVPCGFPGGAAGTCYSDDDCDFCGDGAAPGGFICHEPGEGPDNPGTCVPAAEVCADIGTSVAVLPSPWANHTQLCSEDSACANINIDLNVGKVIRDFMDINEVAGIAIADAAVQYGMHQCTDLVLTANIGCGVCVPCNEDVDCMPIQIDPLILQIFNQDPLAAIAGAILIEMLYGDNSTHDLYFFCNPVGHGYGVCTPCANPLQPCGQDEPPEGDGNCDHDVCSEGAALDPACNSCTNEVCTNDNFCCSEEWDAICVGLVGSFCITSCG